MTCQSKTEHDLTVVCLVVRVIIIIKIFKTASNIALPGLGWVLEFSFITMFMKSEVVLTTRVWRTSNSGFRLATLHYASTGQRNSLTFRAALTGFTPCNMPYTMRDITELSCLAPFTYTMLTKVLTLIIA